jgi:predicted DCC family thiol-disulfide oxidoreductase YuxK
MDSGNSIVLFDGVCNLCSGTVRFLIRNDRKARLKFAALQSVEGKHLLSQTGINGEPATSIVFIDNGNVYIKSAAALQIAGRLDMPWRAMVLLRIIPRALRDRIYDIIARNRYRWFGRKQTCVLPSPRIISRFL